jgi:uncharacterized protein (DUF39 family)
MYRLDTLAPGTCADASYAYCILHLLSDTDVRSYGVPVSFSATRVKPPFRWTLRRTTIQSGTQLLLNGASAILTCKHFGTISSGSGWDRSTLKSVSL